MAVKVKKEYFAERLKNLDKVVLILVIVLFCLGVLSIYSITGISKYNNRTNDSLAYVSSTVVSGIVGIAGMLFFSFLPYKIVKNLLGPLSVIGTVGLLALTVVFGHGTQSNPSAQRWLTIGIQFQPAEFARMGIAVSTAWLIQYMVKEKVYYTKKFWGKYLYILGYVIACAGMIVVQPDLGSAIVVAGMGVIIFLSSGISRKQLLILVGTGLTLLVVAIILASVLLREYQMSRIYIWLDPFGNELGRQNVMGFISIATGGLFGVGLGNSMQKYGFAIEPQTDFIITIIAEELGTITVLFIMAAYFLIAARCFLTAFKGRDVFSSLVCIGVGSFFLIQPLVNLGGIIGLIPLSGVTLPLISSGGTSLMTTMFMIGIYLNIRGEIVKDVQVKRKKEEVFVSEKVIPFKQAQ